ncbi:MAG TPA: CHAD domain-containing protein [Fimbriiglobus sp.]|nr:CHAD domain-containing protein [Fimbriiglobus sp.]
MADGKWITGLTPEIPADEAARVVLSVRLSAVRHYLPLAAERASEDIEHVHQLRVATRRATAAVRTFRDLLPKKLEREAKRALRAIRCTAGGARDWDVFLLRLAEQPPGTDAADFLAGYALRKRLAAQETLAVVAADRAPAIHELCAALPAAVRTPAGAEPRRIVGEYAAAILGELYAQFATEVEANPTTPDELHQLRITGKRLRYAVEVFAACYGPPLRETLYPAVEEAQELLGRVQDAAVAAARLEQVESELCYLPAAVADRLRPGVAALAADVRGSAEADEQAFREWVGRWRTVAAECPLGQVSPST